MGLALSDRVNQGDNDMQIIIGALLCLLVVLNVVEIALYTDRLEDLCNVVDRLQELSS